MGHTTSVTARCNMSLMAASELRCCVCGSAFYGRVDARYCCGACRQKAHRARARAALRTATRAKAAATRQSAREARERAYAARDQARTAHRKTRAALAASEAITRGG